MRTIVAQMHNLQADITFIQRFTENRQSATFADMPSIIEAFSTKIFNEIEDLNLVNTNLFATNYPTVDLADPLKRVAIQVTITADSTKIKETLKAFETKNPHTGISLADTYDRLIIFGFCKLNRPRAPLPSYCSALNVNDLIKILTQQGKLSKIESIIDTLQDHVDYSRLSPRQDIPSLAILIAHLDRKAFLGGHRDEGSYYALRDALTELNELLGKGTLNGKATCKPLFGYATEIQEMLLPIKSDILEMGKHVDHLLNCGFEERLVHQIDTLRVMILKRVAKLAKMYSIKITNNLSRN